MNYSLGKLGRVGVLMGGYSSERAISLKSGSAVFEALKEEGCDAVKIDIVDKNEEAILRQIGSAKIDAAFVALHGQLGEDGKIQYILEKADIPYTGSGIIASQNAINKIRTKELFVQNRIDNPRYVSLSGGGGLNNIINNLEFSPWVVKPVSEGSSIGVTIVFDKDGLAPAIENALSYGDECIIEEYVKGRELTVGIIGRTPLPVVEIIPKNEFFDFTAKYQKGSTEYIAPARLPDGVSNSVQDLAWRAHLALGCEDLSRVDILLDGENKGYVLEVNTIPGFTSTSLLPLAAKTIGLIFNQLCLQLIGNAYAKKEKSKDIYTVC